MGAQQQAAAHAAGVLDRTAKGAAAGDAGGEECRQAAVRRLGPAAQLVVGALAGTGAEDDLLRVVERRGGGRRDQQDHVALLRAGSEARRRGLEDEIAVRRRCAQPAAAGEQAGERQAEAGAAPVHWFSPGPRLASPGPKSVARGSRNLRAAVLTASAVPRSCWLVRRTSALVSTSRRLGVARQLGDVAADLAHRRRGVAQGRAGLDADGVVAVGEAIDVAAQCGGGDADRVGGASDRHQRRVGPGRGAFGIARQVAQVHQRLGERRLVLVRQRDVDPAHRFVGALRQLVAPFPRTAAAATRLRRSPDRAGRAGAAGSAGCPPSRFCSRIVARPVIRLRSTVARVLSFTGVAGSMPITTSTVPGRCSANEKPVTAPTRMPLMRTSLRTCSPSSDWRVK